MSPRTWMAVDQRQHRSDIVALDAHRRRRATPSDDPAELRLRLFAPLLRYVEDRHGPDAVAAVLAEADMADVDARDGDRWISVARAARLTAAVRARLDDDREFKAAAAYKLRDSLGLFVHLVRALSIRRLAEYVVGTMHRVSRVSRYEIQSATDRSLALRYTSDRDESRLLCLTRQAAIEVLPTLWGLPRARVTERACIARGDDHCGYDVRWHAQVRLWHAVAGGVLGAAAGGAAAALGAVGLSPVATLAALGAVAAYAIDLRRVHRINLQLAEADVDHVRALADAYAEANEEILEWNRRQRSWTRALEAQIEDNAAHVARLTQTAREIADETTTRLRAITHDIRSPLTVLRFVRPEIERHVPRRPPEVDKLLDDVDRTVDIIENLVNQILDPARTASQKLAAAVEDIDTEALAERLRRRLRALVLGRDIRVSVLVSRETPAVVRCDPIAFERVLDNLIGNAAKFTNRGSIVVELSGRPGFLVVKISDTGPGIGPDHIERVFRAGERTPEARGVAGQGLGLAIVVRLLDQLGGRLEVMSQPGVGTTFWVHVPAQPPAGDQPRPPAGDDAGDDEAIGRVVHVRRFNGRARGAK
ncbi:MAG: sensor histidine kinase [Deltaproteobacteria bacterium]|nr:MAG: sensor histidine kinase [Deltaproteobacteria bacterium]